MTRSAAWRGYRAFTLLSGGLLVVASGWLAACHFLGREQEGCAVGMSQRLVLGIQYVWMVVLAVRPWGHAGRRPSNLWGE